MQSYTITWLDSDSLRPTWDTIPSLEIAQYPWYKSGDKQHTWAQIAVSPKRLHVRYRCEDKHIFAQYTEPNDPVSLDSCVEFFLCPDPAKPDSYFNPEINCCGNILLGYGEGRHGRVRASVEIIRAIEVKHSIPGPTKEESPDDKGWEIEATIPLDVLASFKPFPMPQKGSVWRGNFYRCGGKTDEQFASWMPIDLPEPEYHCPQFFGLLPIG